ncbi:Melanoma-associated antigen F1 [Gonapodya sp. JEL0774]|nr:Melanoma-associated antigen F1 [Gonapodya sp. JEL0774]
MTTNEQGSPDPSLPDEDEEAAQVVSRKGKEKATRRPARNEDEDEPDAYEDEEDEEEVPKTKSKKKRDKGNPSASQPSQRRFRQEADDEEGGEDDSADTNTQAAKAAGRSHKYATNNLTRDELDRKVRDLVRLAIFNEYKRVPLKKDDIMKRGEFFVRFFLLGVHLTTQESVYILDSQHTSQIVQRSDQENIATGILMLVLALVYVNRGTESEANILRILAQLNLTENIPTMNISVEKFLEQLAKDGHLDRLQRVEGDKPVVEYKWGPRAKVEVDEEGIVAFIRDFYPEDRLQAVQKQLEKIGGGGKKKSENVEIGAGPADG